MSITERYTKALKERDIPEIQNIISELNGLGQKGRQDNLQLYQQIGEDLFNLSLEIPNHNLKEFTRTETNILNKKSIKQGKDNFEAVLLDFISKTEKNCKSLKAHFLFQLDNNSTEETEVLILTDRVSKHNPLIARITEVFPQKNIQKSTIEEFITECKKNPDLQNKKFVCLLAMATNIITDQDSQENLKELLNIFKTSSLIKLKKFEDISSSDYRLDKITDDIHEEIQSICGKSFNNRDITFQEEVIIKKCFQSSNAPIIDYKILKAGFSGSKVIEVQPLKIGTGLTGRFVIKFGKKDQQKKIAKEKNAFENHVDDLNIPGYKGTFVETELYAAIKYNYASSDTKTDSFPFATLLQNHVSGKPPLFPFNDIFIQLFACKPFEYWNTPTSSTCSIKDLYEDYFDEQKLISFISTIEGIQETDVKLLPIWIKFEKIKEIEIRLLKKVCHGDLHSENFFKDESGVYLIDFGYTKERHAVIDHSTLEASIKFKHIPTYIPIEELIVLEKEALSIDSFSQEFKINSNRHILSTLFEMCLRIRQDALQFLSNRSNPLEYFISLFFITLRQIQYPDLNQRYALRSAECLADEIVKLIESN